MPRPGRRTAVKGVVASTIAFAPLLMPVICKAETFNGQQLAERPGTSVTRTKDGDAEITTLTRNGVTITETRRGNDVETVGGDFSGHGAVLCAWNIYRGFRLAYDLCFKGKYPELEADLDQGIDEINGFIAENDIFPNTKVQVEEAAKAELEAALAKIATTSADQMANFCASNDYATAVVKLSAMARPERKKMFTDLLAAPRPPVLNPCL